MTALFEVENFQIVCINILLFFGNPGDELTQRFSVFRLFVRVINSFNFSFLV